MNKQTVRLADLTDGKVAEANRRAKAKQMSQLAVIGMEETHSSGFHR